LLNELGYSNVRDYRGGITDWIASGSPVEKAGAESVRDPDSEAMTITGPPLVASSEGFDGSGPARVSSMRRWDNSFLGVIERRSTLQLFLVWIGLILVSGIGYWLGALLGRPGLREMGSPVGADLRGLGNAVYFSFVTATSVGYGDIVPVGIGRVMAVAEAISGLLIFGAVIAKFVSHRQDELVSEIHRVTFDERLDRVQTNLHLVISELLSITSLCEGPQVQHQRITTRLESVVLIFFGELRATHDLLYQPRLAIEEAVLSAILANLASALSLLSELLTCLPGGFDRSEPLELGLKNVTRLAEDICGNCVPHAYTPRLIFWMNRIQATARKIK